MCDTHLWFRVTNTSYASGKFESRISGFKRTETKPTDSMTKRNRVHYQNVWFATLREAREYKRLSLSLNRKEVSKWKKNTALCHLCR